MPLERTEHPARERPACDPLSPTQRQALAMLAAGELVYRANGWAPAGSGGGGPHLMQTIEALERRGFVKVVNRGNYRQCRARITPKGRAEASRG